MDGLAAHGFTGRLHAQSAKARWLESDLEEAQRKLSSCERSVWFSQFRDLAAAIYLETARKDYGLPAEAATRFFSSLNDRAGHVADPQVKRRLEEILGLRDIVTAGLEKADLAILPNSNRCCSKGSKRRSLEERPPALIDPAAAALASRPVFPR